MQLNEARAIAAQYEAQLNEARAIAAQARLEQEQEQWARHLQDTESRAAAAEHRAKKLDAEIVLPLHREKGALNVEVEEAVLKALTSEAVLKALKSLHDGGDTVVSSTHTRSLVSVAPQCRAVVARYPQRGVDGSLCAKRISHTRDITKVTSTVSKPVEAQDTHTPEVDFKRPDV